MITLGRHRYLGGTQGRRPSPDYVLEGSMLEDVVSWSQHWRFTRSLQVRDTHHQLRAGWFVREFCDRNFGGSDRGCCRRFVYSGRQLK